MKKILVIEDNLEVRENIEEILELANYQVITADNGKEGLKHAKSASPDLILCDIMMPQMDGYEVLYYLSKDKNAAHIPFIFLTAKSEKTDMRKGMGLGADDYITKPFDDVDLLGSIERRIKKNAELKALSGDSAVDIEKFITVTSESYALNNMSEKRKIKTFDKKEIIYREGDYPHNIYYVNKGKVRLYKIHPEGKELTIAIIEEKSFIGHTALLQNNNFGEFAAAIEDAELLQISRHDFLELVFKNREVSKKFLQIVSKNILEMEVQLLEMAYDTVRKKIAMALSSLYNKLKKHEGDFVKIARDDIATMAGTATETVIRTLSEFKKEGLISIEKKGIAILLQEELDHIKF